MHTAMFIGIFAGAVVAAGALGYAFRGAIRREIVLSKNEAVLAAQHLEQALEADANKLGAAIRARLAKL